MKMAYRSPFPNWFGREPRPARRIDSLIGYSSRERPNFIFDRFDVDQKSMKENPNAAEVQDYLMGHAKVLYYDKPLHKTPSTCSAVRRPLEELYFNGSIADLSDQDRKITLPP